MTTSPSTSPAGPSPSTCEKDRTSVALSLPRQSRFSARISSSPTRTMERSASGEPKPPNIVRAVLRRRLVGIVGLLRWLRIWIDMGLLRARQLRILHALVVDRVQDPDEGLR